MGKTSLIHLADLASFWLSKGKIGKTYEVLTELRKEIDELDTMAYRKAMWLSRNANSTTRPNQKPTNSN